MAERVGSWLLGGLEGCVRLPPPSTPAPTVGVLVLAGSSGRVEVARTELFAAQGALAVSVRWFGGPGQPGGICEIPLETFTRVVGSMRNAGVERIALVGTSKGAEASLLVASLDRSMDVVIAISPSAYVWANVGPGSDGEVLPWRSSWTWEGSPLPFVPYDETWVEPPGPAVAYRSMYEQSLVTFADRREAAAIPVEQASAEMVLIAGGDDQMWPSEAFARSLVERRATAGLSTELVVGPGAGHRIIFPGEVASGASPDRAHGGSVSADRALGSASFPLVLRALGLV